MDPVLENSELNLGMMSIRCLPVATLLLSRYPFDRYKIDELLLSGVGVFLYDLLILFI